MAVVVRRKPGFHALSNTGSSKIYGAGSRETKSEESEMEKGHVGEQSLLRSLFHPRKYMQSHSHSHAGKEGEGEREMGEKERGMGTGMEKTPVLLSSDGARFSKSSLNALHFDEENPVGLITLEDVLEGTLPFPFSCPCSKLWY